MADDDMTRGGMSEFWDLFSISVGWGHLGILALIVVYTWVTMFLRLPLGGHLYSKVDMMLVQENK